MAGIAGCRGRNVARMFAGSGRPVVAGGTSPGRNANMIEASWEPGSGPVAAVARGRGLHVIRRLSLGSGAVMAGHARAGNDSGMRIACPGPAHCRRMALVAGLGG